MGMFPKIVCPKKICSKFSIRVGTHKNFDQTPPYQYSNPSSKSCSTSEELSTCFISGQTTKTSLHPSATYKWVITHIYIYSYIYTYIYIHDIYAPVMSLKMSSFPVSILFGEHQGTPMRRNSEEAQGFPPIKWPVGCYPATSNSHHQDYPQKKNLY